MEYIFSRLYLQSFSQSCSLDRHRSKQLHRTGTQQAMGSSAFQPAQVAGNDGVVINVIEPTIAD